MEPGRPRPAKKIDVVHFSLLSPCGETAALDRCFKGLGDSVRRLFSLFHHLLPTWRASAARLEQHHGKHADDPQTRLVQNIGSRFPCRWCVHHSERLDAHAVDHASHRKGRNCLGRVVLGALRTAVPDVLGGASDLSCLAVRCPPRTGGRSYHSESARPAVHRYPDELYVSKRGVVVCRHADPVLFDLSPALLDGAARWTTVVSVHRMRCGIFRALCVARALAPKRIVGTRRFRNLSFAGVCARDVAGDVVHTIACALGMVSSSRRRFRGRINAVSGGTTALSRPVRIHFRRFRYWRVLCARNRRHCWSYFALPR